MAESTDFKKIAEQLKEANKSDKDINSNLLALKNISTSESKLSFQKEGQTELQMNLMKEQNGILESILNKIESDTNTSAKKDKGIDSSFFAKFIPKSFLGLFSPIFKTLFSKKIQC